MKSFIQVRFRCFWRNVIQIVKLLGAYLRHLLTECAHCVDPMHYLNKYHHSYGTRYAQQHPSTRALTPLQSLKHIDRSECSQSQQLCCDEQSICHH